MAGGHRVAINAEPVPAIERATFSLSQSQENVSLESVPVVRVLHRLGQKVFTPARLKSLLAHLSMAHADWILATFRYLIISWKWSRASPSFPSQ